MESADLIGETLPGGFRVGRYVASGGFAWIFEAYTPERARCAIKVPHQNNPDGLKRFVRETKVLRELPPNRHCVRYVGDGRLPDGRPFLAMEFVDGRTLAQILEPRPRWEPRDACALGTQLCSALRGLHRMGVANRDVSPNNIMLSTDRHLKLMDFGLVKDAQGLLHLLEEEDILVGRDFAENLDRGLLVGTLDYVAPEQLADSSVQGEAQTQTDTWSDVYSVGLILWQLLTGRKLFQLDLSAADPQTMARRVLAYVEMRTRFNEETLRRPSAIPEPLFAILIRSLRLDPRRRQRNAIELGHDIQKYLETGEAFERDDSRTENVSLKDFLDFLEDAEANEPTNVRRVEGDVSRPRPMSSIPVVLDFDDQTVMSEPVVIPRQDPPPSTPEEDLDALMADIDDS